MADLRVLEPPPERFLGDPNEVIAIAETEIGVANNFILRLAELASSLTPPVITPEFPTGGAAPALSVPSPPTMAVPVWVAPGIPAAFTEVLETEDLEVAPFDAAPPVLVYGAAPPAFGIAVPVEPPLNLVFEDPTLVVNIPPPPDLLMISVVPFEGLNIPEFDVEEPTLVLVDPSIREYVPGDLYTSSLLVALQATLEQRITTGGTGLSLDDETALWNRGREREAKSYEDGIRALDEMEELGYMLPPGLWVDNRMKLIRERDAQDRGHSREVMIKAAEMQLDNVKHALTTSTALEGQLMDYSNAVEQRLFESCKYATEAGIAIYNGKVAAYAAQVEIYKAKVNAYEAQIRAELAKVEAYKIAIEAEKLKVEINNSLVAQYKVMTEIALSNIEIYKAELSGIQTKAEIERTKVMVFGEQVKAYGAQVNAYTAGIEAYRASLEGEKTKAQVYTAQVEAYKAQVDASARQIEARVAAFKGQIDAKNSEWQGYTAQTQGEASRMQAISATSGAQADVYRAVVQGQSSFNETLTKQWQVALDQNQRVSEIAIQTAKVNSENYVSTRQLAIEAAKVGATVSAQLGAAALNAVNWSSSLSSSNSVSNSAAVSASINTSHSDSISTNHNYNYS